MNTYSQPSIMDKKEEKAIEEIEYTKLLFDPHNPRLPSNVQNGGSDAAVYEFMLAKSNVTDLMFSIGESGFFNGEPLLVVPDDGGIYHVVEGNRRLAAVRLLHHPELAPIKRNMVFEIATQAKSKPDKIPCIVYAEKDAILDFLGYRHITGIDEWDSLMKARYLTQLYDHYISNHLSQPPQIYSVLARKIGSRSDAVKKLLDGFEIYKKVEENDFYGIHDLDETNFSFSLLTTALSYNQIKDFVHPSGITNEVDDGHLKELTKWVFEKNSENKTIVGESRNLKVLNSIVGSAPALEKLRSGIPLEEAGLFSDHPAKIFSEAVQMSYRRLRDAKSVSHNVQKYNHIDLDNLKDLNGIVKELYLIVKNNLVMDAVSKAERH